MNTMLYCYLIRTLTKQKVIVFETACMIVNPIVVDFAASLITRQWIGPQTNSYFLLNLFQIVAAYYQYLWSGLS